ncbi:MAG: plasmid replication protein, CyRepA1 family [Microcystis sp.]|uniref:plasmid replication protein, CyRepA1 family n=1 Tax=Microcystis sp. TaxID=1127 RepID=UPI00391A5A61
MLKASHLNEWLSSAVHPDIIRLNVESLEGDAALERLTENAIEAIGKDQKTPHSYQYATAPVARILDRYSDMSSEGWWASGIDILTGEPSQWGCYKPDKPRISKEKLKPIKYEHPGKTPTEIFALRVSYGIGLKIAEKQGLKDEYLARVGDNSLDSEDREFWQWVIDNPSIAILITEGAKKAGSLLTAGYVAIALPGIYSGYRQLKDCHGKAIDSPYLIPQLLPFCGGGRDIVFCFDQESNPKTIENVRKAIEKTGKLLGYKGCKVSVARWDKSHKGVDDLIASQGVEAFDQLQKKRLPLEKFNLEIIKAHSLEKWLKFHTFTAKEKINQQYLGINPPKQGEILIVNSPTNTGKSTLLKKWSKEIYSDMGIIRIGNRNSLELQFCNESEFYHLQSEKDLSDILLSDPKKRVSFCFPSLIYTNSSHWENTVIFGDEIDGTIQQALFLNKDPDNLDRFKEALELCDRGVFLSGTLYDHHIDYLKALCPTKTFRIIQNTYQPQRPKIKLLAGTFSEENPDKINSRDKSPLLDRILSNHEPIMIQSDSKHFLNSLERLVKNSPNTDTLLVTSDTLVTDKKVRDFIENPNGYIKGYSDKNPTRRLVVLASPTMTSGNDITIKYFSRDYHYYCGQLSAVLISQKIIRIRDTDCERIISIPEYITSDDTEKCRYLDQWQNSLIMAQINLLDEPENKAELIKKLTDSLDSPHYKEACITKWIRDFERSNYQECVIKLLTQQGYEIELLAEGESESRNTKKLKEVSNEIKDETSEAIYQASDKYIGKDERSIEPETKDDLMAVEKAKIVAQLPNIHESESWSSELVRLVKYDKPLLIQQLNRRYLLHNPDTLKTLTAKRYHRHGQRVSEGKTTDLWRDKNNLAFLTAIEKMGLKDWVLEAIANNTQFSHDSPAVTEIITKCHSKGISHALGRRPGKDPIKFLSWLIGCLGYALGKKRVRVGDAREYHYTIKEACHNAQFLSEIGDAIERRYKSMMDTCTPLNWGFLDEKITVKNQPIETDSNPDISMVSAVLGQPNPLIEGIDSSGPKVYSEPLNTDDIFLATDFLPGADREGSLLNSFKQCLECVTRPKWSSFLAIIPISVKDKLLGLISASRQDSLISEFTDAISECS